MLKLTTSLQHQDPTSLQQYMATDWSRGIPMERWCEIYADEAGRLVIENHNASGADVKFLTPMPFWTLVLPFRCYPAKVRVT